MPFVRLLAPLLFVPVLSFRLAYGAQTPPPCDIPPQLLESDGPRLLTAEQENRFRESVFEHSAVQGALLRDEALVAFPRELVDHLRAGMGADSASFRVFLDNSPYVTAYAVLGGDIYVTRKLVSLAESVDELASVLAHEMAHIVRGDAPSNLREFIAESNITDGDSADAIEGLYHRLIEEAPRSARDRDHLDTQVSADRLGLYIAANAGFDPRAFEAFWDRMTGIEGKKGNFLSDFFGQTKPESKRLREIASLADGLYASCATSDAVSSIREEFASWQRAVATYAGVGHSERLDGVLRRVELANPLRSDASRLRFSSDAAYLLVQNDAVVDVVRRDPFETWLRIEAVDADDAHITPDSREVVILKPGLRVERWDLGTRQRVALDEIHFRELCVRSAVSPDGATLACLTPTWDIVLLDVATRRELTREKRFYETGNVYSERFRLLFGGRFVQFAFSPDGRYFLAASRPRYYAYDLSRAEEIGLPRSIKQRLNNTFAFVGPDRLLGVADDRRETSVVAFPSGESLLAFPMGSTQQIVGANEDYVLVSPVPDYPLGVVELATRKLVLANKDLAFDIRGPHFVSQTATGELALYRRAKTEEASVPESVAELVLPKSPLGTLRAAAVSSDLRWLAMSNRLRSGVWDTATGERVAGAPAFQGAWFDESGHLVADFVGTDQSDRVMVEFDPRTRQMSEGPRPGDDPAQQFGEVLISLSRKESSDDVAVVRAASTEDLSEAWTDEIPAGVFRRLESESAFAIQWNLEETKARSALEERVPPALFERLSELDHHRLIEIFDVGTGEVVHRFVFDKKEGALRLDRIESDGLTAAVTDNLHRVHIYRFDGGEGTRVGRLFGRAPVLSRDGSRLSVQTEPARLTIYDARTLDVERVLDFTAPVAMARFGASAERLFVLTTASTSFALTLP